MKPTFLISILVFLFTGNITAQITLEHVDGGLLLLERGEKVLKLQTEPLNYQGTYERRNYIHPLWGIDGAVLTEDFPPDHLHHRGIYWAWHQVWIDGKRIGDPWEIKSFTQRITGIEFISQRGGSGLIKTEVEWLSDQWMKEKQMVPYLKEHTSIAIYPQTKNYRRIDFEISLLALEDKLSIGGSEDVKGYSGFSVRMVLPEDVLFLGPDGAVEPQVTQVTSPGYVNVTGSMGVAGKNAGIVMLDHPDNPGYPQRWILRKEKSMQNPVFPGQNPVSVSTTDPLVLKYTLLVYKGTMNHKKIIRAVRR